MSSKIIQISDCPSHDTIISQSKQTPTVIYVSNSVLPACKSFTPQYDALAEEYADSGVKFCQMEFTSKTSMMFKFSPNQLPVTVLMVRDAWCKTVMGPEMRELKAKLMELLEEARRGGELR